MSQQGAIVTADHAVRDQGMAFVIDLSGLVTAIQSVAQQKAPAGKVAGHQTRGDIVASKPLFSLTHSRSIPASTARISLH
ncbi:hypothetical protein OEG84_20265 [Hoeflea sp. G2-23]|uniref:CheW-like domain-containing protein n=1 Tax=Hoeflea algicola TaxID=2983763 RepID=A0ABT3ZDU0_9HYPH|nr:hypothetical protein [Hoeflea algicola]MCY0149970.1 hypothetical protein [Hoeflea algicola]